MILSTIIEYSNEQFFLIWMFILWIVISYFNFEDIRARVPDKFNAIIHVIFTAPLFMFLINNAYLNGLIWGWGFAFGILLTTIYIIAIKYIGFIDMNIK